MTSTQIATKAVQSTARVHWELELVCLIVYEAESVYVGSVLDLNLQSNSSLSSLAVLLVMIVMNYNNGRRGQNWATFIMTKMAPISFVGWSIS